VEKVAHAPTRALLLLQRSWKRERLARLDADPKRAREALADCRAAARAWPELDVDEGRLSAVVALLEVRRTQTPLQTLWARPGEDDTYIVELLSRAIEEPALAGPLLAQPELAAILRGAQSAPAEKLGLLEWVLGNASHDEALARRASNALAAADRQLLHRLRWRTVPPTEEHARMEALYQRALAGAAP
jgi:hypothetical protein